MNIVRHIFINVLTTQLQTHGWTHGFHFNGSMFTCEKVSASCLNAFSCDRNHSLFAQTFLCIFSCLDTSTRSKIVHPYSTLYCQHNSYWIVTNKRAFFSHSILATRSQILHHTLLQPLLLDLISLCLFCSLLPPVIPIF